MDAPVTAWPRPYFKASEQQTKIFFVCFGKAPLADLPLSLSRFGVPESEALSKLEVHEHLRELNPSWFEGWWGASFGAVAERDLGEDLPLLTTSDVCVTLGLELAISLI